MRLVEILKTQKNKYRRDTTMRPKVSFHALIGLSFIDSSIMIHPYSICLSIHFMMIRNLLILLCLDKSD